MNYLILDCEVHDFDERGISFALLVDYILLFFINFLACVSYSINCIRLFGHSLTLVTRFENYWRDIKLIRYYLLRRQLNIIWYKYKIGMVDNIFSIRYYYWYCWKIINQKQIIESINKNSTTLLFLCHDRLCSCLSFTCGQLTLLLPSSTQGTIHF